MTCADLGYGPEAFTINDPADGLYDVDGINSLSLRLRDDAWDFFGSLRVDAVLVTADGRSALWDVGPEATGWPSLSGPPDEDNVPLSAESITFCFDYDLFINPNAYLSGKRKYRWNIEKSAEVEALTLSSGQFHTVGYQVKVSLAGDDSSCAVEGPLFINNPTPTATMIAGVSVMVGEVAAAVTCPAPLPYLLAAGGVLECSYQAALPDCGDRLVVASIDTSSGLPDAEGSELASAETHTSKFTEEDECIDVTDSLFGDLGTVCAPDAPKTFEYSLQVGGYAACGDYQVDNTASFVAKDSGATGSASDSVAIDVPCAGGCSLTQGYWKTHSQYGPAPFDAAWDLLQPSGANSSFFLSGQSYYQVLWTAPRGNPYYILAHQYIAAVLNGLNGADTSSINGDLAAARNLFLAYGPSGVTKPMKATFIALAGRLGAFNEGAIGPGHCDE